ncbi:hypothetical protein BJX76DRAFT_358919 [Aspergillus varians]
MDAVDDNGFTTPIDVGLLGTVMYEVITGTKCEIDLFKNNPPIDGRAYWPERRFLPSTEGIWLGWVIEGCWSGEISSAHNLLQALNSVNPRFSSPIAGSLATQFLAAMRDRPDATIIGALGLAVFTLIVGRKAFLLSR